MFERPDLATTDTLVFEIQGLFTQVVSGPSESRYFVRVALKTLSLVGPSEYSILAVADDLFGWGYGRLWFENFRDPYMNTCLEYMKFTVEADLNDTGYWFGPDGPIFYVGPGAIAAAGGKKSEVVGTGTVLKAPIPK